VAARQVMEANSPSSTQNEVCLQTCSSGRRLAIGALRSAVGGAGGVVLLAGEAGMGKTALIAFLSQQLPVKRAVADRSGIRRMTLLAVPVRSDAPERLGGG
jgi:predicted ATP-dependent serine protease